MTKMKTKTSSSTFKTISLFHNIAKILSPPPKLLVSDWADTYRKLSPEASAEPGQWHTSRAEFQREIMNSVNDPTIQDIVIKSSAQVGKALAIDTPIPCPTGWKTMGDLKEGDQVFDEAGNICDVTFVTPVMYNRQCYNVIFSDGTCIVADAEHQWYVDSETKLDNGKYSGIITTEVMHKTYRYCKNRHRYAIRMSNALKTDEIELPIKPYLLGIWLGDGNSASGQITIHQDDVEVADYIKSLGYPINIRRISKVNDNILNIQVQPYEKSTICIRNHDMSIVGVTKKGYCAECARQYAMKHKWKNDRYLDPVVNKPITFYHLLAQAGLINNKHIPAQYLRASFQQRLDLLKGLMDSDGHIGKKGRCEITLKSKILIDNISELLYTLGIKHTVNEKMAVCTNSKERISSKYWRISFLVYSDTPVFNLKRKLARLPERANKRTTETERRRVIEVNPIQSVPVKCISVNSKNHLYLAGKQMVPTHNTEIVLNICGYFMDYEPTSLLVIQPTIDMGETFSKDRLAPMIRDTDVLKAKVKEPRTKDSDNTILHKKFPGGHITIAGANSPASLASRPIRVLLCDEIDRYPVSAGSEGDPVKLGEKRTTTFWNRKRIKVSTPTIAGFSKIDKEFMAGTQEEWSVQCPCCGKYQMYEFRRIVFATVEMSCLYCKESFSERDWKSQPHRWIASNPEAKKVRSFHLNELCSPWKKWDEIIDDFRSANEDRKKTGSIEALKVFVNTSLGETWEERGDGADDDDLLKRREIYSADIPDGVLLITAGVDVQDDRIEIEIVGWSRGYESWGLYKKVINQDPQLDSTWNELEELYDTEMFFQNGTGLMIAAMCIDTGGHHTNQVYRFIKNMAKKNKRIHGIKGYSNTPGIPLIYKKTKVDIKNAKGTVIDHTEIYILGVDAGKEDIISRLKIADVGPGYCHFPSNQERGYNQTYMQGITSEEKVTKLVKNKLKIVWVKKAGIRNEPLDLRNYAYAAVEILGPNWNSLESKIANGINYMKKSTTHVKKRRSGVASKGVEV